MRHIPEWLCPLSQLGPGGPLLACCTCSGLLRPTLFNLSKCASSPLSRHLRTRIAPALPENSQQATSFAVTFRPLQPPIVSAHNSLMMLSVAILGQTNAARRKVQFGIKQPDRLYHTYIIGKTGTGKSTSARQFGDARFANGSRILSH